MLCYVLREPTSFWSFANPVQDLLRGKLKTLLFFFLILKKAFSFLLWEPWGPCSKEAASCFVLEALLRQWRGSVSFCHGLICPPLHLFTRNIFSPLGLGTRALFSSGRVRLWAGKCCSTLRFFYWGWKLQFIRARSQVSGEWTSGN